MPNGCSKPCEPKKVDVLKVVFRADASLQIGTGHVMRCLTLADALTALGSDCQFICREHQGNLIDLIRSKGYITHVLPARAESIDAKALAPDTRKTLPAHAQWLGTSQEEDAKACEQILIELCPDWLVVDHYALDARWEVALKPHYAKLLVIDDLADRPHDCDVLLDQTLGRIGDEYEALVPANCQKLCGSQYALLRPEFAALRDYSLGRRVESAVRQLLITLGGVDKDNATGDVLEALRDCRLPADCNITVVLGPTAPWLAEVERKSQQLPWATKVLVGVTDMAQLMADSDLAIGAAGSTAWERCCLGLPTVMLVLADNQRGVALGLAQAKAAEVIAEPQAIRARLPELLNRLIENADALTSMSKAALRVVDGRGVEAISEIMESTRATN